MRLSKKDKELLLTVLQSYAATQRLRTWNDEDARRNRIRKVDELANRIYYDLIGGIK